MYRLILLIYFVPAFAFAQVQQTAFEKTGGTATYEETIQYYAALDSAFETANLTKLGTTDSGEPLHLFIISKEGYKHPVAFKNSSKTIVMINNGIHPGEPDGIEASKMIARDVLTDTSAAVLDSLIIAIIPVYNIGGALNRNSTSRVNQNGPVEYGFRGNARNYDLNRDFIKADTRNAQSFQRIFGLVDPDIFIDTHVSNGADYQYVITHIATQHNKLGTYMGAFMHETLRPQMEQAMEAKGESITPYVNVYNTTPDERGFSQFLDGPRYSTGFAALFNVPAFMIETHMLKPFEARVQASYTFMEVMFDLALKHGPNIQLLKDQTVFRYTPGSVQPIDWQLKQSESRKIIFKGYEAEYLESKITGFPRLKYNRNKPYEKEINYYDTYIPKTQVVVPKAYIIPQGWHDIILKLQQAGVSVVPLESDTTIAVEAYKIESFETSRRPYEGHYPHSDVKTSTWKWELEFRKGDFIIPVEGRMARFIVEVLEPEAADSYFRWNFFDTILQRKEGFSSYVFEDLALEIIKENPRIGQNLERLKERDTTLAKSPYAQLNWIYGQSVYQEKAYNLYPVFRISE